jgi:transcriptional regulator with XRE-family HTH domain
MVRAKSPTSVHGNFGQRLAALRKAAALSQRQLAKQTDVSPRMIAYYEKRAALPPGHVLSALAETLAITVDELVGNERARPPRKSTTSRRLQRRLQQLERLPLKDRKAVLAIIDTYLERHRLLQRTG